MPRLQDALSALTRRLLAVPPWAFLVLAALLRVAFALKLGSPFYQADEWGYDGPAWNLAQHGVIGFGDRPTVIAPVPVSFFGLFYALFGHNALYPRLGQAFVGTATVWCLSRMTERATASQAAGRWALAIASVYPFFIYYNGMLISETLYLFFIVLGLWGYTVEREGAGWKPALAGLALGVAGLCRIEAVPIALLIWAGSAAACVLGRQSRRSFALAVVFWALPLFGWSQRNLISTGQRSLDNHGGITLLHGTLLFDLAQEMDTADAMKAVEKMSFYIEAKKLPPAERDEVLRRAAFDFMRQHPAETVLQWGYKFRQFWRFYPRPEKVYYQNADVSSADAGLGRRVLTLISLLFEPGLILGGLFGLWSLRRWEEFYPLWLFILGTMGIHVLIVSMMRYRLPVMPALILGASALLARAAQSTKR